MIQKVEVAEEIRMLNEENHEGRTKGVDLVGYEGMTLEAVERLSSAVMTFVMFLGTEDSRNIETYTKARLGHVQRQ